jgi:hypothetical protein
MLSEMCSLCQAATGNYDENNNNNNSSSSSSSSSLLRRTFCIRPTVEEIRRHLHNKATKFVDEFNVRKSLLPTTVNVVLPSECLDNIIDSIFDEDEYMIERSFPCVGQYLSELERIIWFMFENAQNSIKCFDILTTVKFTISYDPILSTVSLETRDNDKNISIGRKIYIRRCEKNIRSTQKTSSSSSVVVNSSSSDNTTINSTTSKVRDMKRDGCIVDFIENGSKQCKVENDEDSFTFDDEFNTFFKQYQNKMFKPYTVRQSDRSILEKFGFEWKNIQLCKGCKDANKRECKCSHHLTHKEKKEKYHIIENMKISKITSPIGCQHEDEDKNTSHSPSSNERMRDISSKSNDYHSLGECPSSELDYQNRSNEEEEIHQIPIENNTIKVLICQYPGCSFQASTKESMKDHFKMRSHGKLSMSREEFNKTYKRSIELRTTTIQHPPPSKKITNKRKREECMNNDKEFQCQFHGCFFATTTKELLKQHCKRKENKGPNMGHMTKEEIDTLYPARSKKLKRENVTMF